MTANCSDSVDFWSCWPPTRKSKTTLMMWIFSVGRIMSVANESFTRRSNLPVSPLIASPITHFPLKSVPEPRYNTILYIRKIQATQSSSKLRAPAAPRGFTRQNLCSPPHTPIRLAKLQRPIFSLGAREVSKHVTMKNLCPVDAWEVTVGLGSG